MAHQTHALPWNTLASNFKHIISYHSHPQRPDIHAQQKPNEAKDLAYFCKAFAKQIHDFSVTERAKYQSVEYYRKHASTWLKSEDPAPESEATEISTTSCNRQKASKASKELTEKRKVIPTNLIQRYDSYVPFLQDGCGRQDVEKWLLDLPSKSAHEGSADWGQGAEIIKVLIMEAASISPALSAEIAENDAAEGERLKRQSMERLLLMANHPGMNILELREKLQGDNFGISRVAGEALRAYIYLNLIIAMREGGSDVCDFVGDGGGENKGEKRRKFMDCENYKRMLRKVTGRYPGDAHALVHRMFFLGNPRESYRWGKTPSRDVLEDLEGLQGYLKGIWRVMVTYDVVVREAGGDPKECEWALGRMFGVRYEMNDCEGTLIS